MQVDVAIVGAGIAGLACARELARHGTRVVLLEKSRGVGGRCATRRCDGLPVDHGVSFYHGRDREFLSELRAVTGVTLIDGWPRRVVGRGAPCQPRAFRPGEQRLAFAEGIVAFAKSLARGLDVRPGRAVTRLEEIDGAFELHADPPGETVRARTAILTPPVPQARELARPLVARHRGLGAVAHLLGEMSTLSCLTVIARYDCPPPPWDVVYPDDSSILQLVCHDSAKRANAGATVLTLQALPGWSRTREHERPDAWCRSMLDEAGRRIGSWASEPDWMQTHRWGHARIAGGGLARPLIVRSPRGGIIGFAGEGFAARGGVEGAWLSGRAAAARLREGVS